MVNPRKEQKKIFIEWEYIGGLLNRLLRIIKKDNQTFVGVYGIPRGGLPIAVYFSHQLNIPLLKYPEPGCLIVDDIADSGNCLKELLIRHSYFLKDNYKIATIYYKKKSVIKPNYYAKTICEKDWIVFPWEKNVE